MIAPAPRLVKSALAQGEGRALPFLRAGKLLELRAERFRRILQHEIKELRVILKEDHGFDITVRILNESPPFVDGQISAAQVDPISIYGVSDRTDIHVRHTAAGKVIPSIAVLFPADIHYAPAAINGNFPTGERKNQYLEHPDCAESMNPNNNVTAKEGAVFTENIYYYFCKKIVKNRNMTNDATNRLK